MLTANRIIARALEISKAGTIDLAGNPVGFTVQAQDHLNSILSDLCMNHDLALARGVYFFSFVPGQVTTVNGTQNFGGPYPFPLDYLRASGSSGSDGTQTGFFYIFNGVPYPMTPHDLGMGDMFVQIPGQQTLPTEYWTDISTEQTANDRIVLTTTATFASAANSITVATATGLVAGMGAAGNGIAPGTLISSSYSSGTSIPLTLPPTGDFPSTAASVFFGIPPNAYIWPGPSGSFPATLRYQRRMPPITDFNRIPWFEGEGYLIEELAARLMETTGDSRASEFGGRSQGRLSSYLKLRDDTTNRAQTVVLDRNRFGPQYSKLRNTKSIGWVLLLCCMLPSLFSGMVI